MTDNFAQIKQDLTAPSIIATLRQDPDIRSKLTTTELAAFDTILNEVGTPDEYASIAEFVMRALPYVKMAYSTSDVSEPIQPPEALIQLIMRKRFL